MGKYLDKFREPAEASTPQTDSTDTAQVYDLAEEAAKRGYPFTYPLPETCNIGEQDPLDFKFRDGQTVYEPGWWRKIPKKRR